LPEPIVNAEKLAELLAEEAEHPTLDYKETLDLSKHDCRLELVRDMAAMMMLGGYIVVGVDNNGKPTGTFTAAEAKLFDQAKLQDLIDNYVSGAEILSAVHDFPTGPIALIYIAPHKDGLAVLEKDGQASDGKTLFFKKGDVFARHGTKSERWNQADVAVVRRRIADSIREEWRRAIEPELLRAAEMGGRARSLASAPLGTFGWQLSRETFEAGLAELLRAEDRVALRHALDQMVKDALTRLWDSESDTTLEELRTILDRLVCFAATALHYGFREWFADAVAALMAIYSSALTVEGRRREPGASGITPERLWLEIIVRVEALGGLCVRQSDWSAIRFLAMQAPADGDYYNSWVRHGLTQAARSNLLEEYRDDKKHRIHLVQLARTLVDEEECLRPDLPSGDEGILNCILQFDMLVVLMTMLGSEPEHGKSWYPNFAFWYTQRVEPIVRRFLTDPAMRHVLLPDGTDDDTIAKALVEIDHLASGEGIMYSGWHGFDDRQIREFIDRHTT
jgi:hypothetical protein